MTSAPGGDIGGDAFRRVAEALRLAMSDGTYTVGSLLPPQRELAERYDVSRDTIQRVFRELVSEGWIETRQGSGTKVVKVQRIHSAGTGPGLLQTVVGQAFDAEEVALDVFSLTSQTLSTHMSTQALRVREKRISPRRIALRLLLPDEQMPMPYPKLKGGESDARLARRMHELSDLHSKVIKGALSDLRRDRLVPEVSVDIRRVPLAPHSKLYLFNRAIALQGFYKLVKRDIQLEDGTELDTIDVLGLRAPLFSYARDADPHSTGSRFVEESQEWFDSVWDLLAEPD
ncbi:GntR family transcriptional regulator [Streptomyces sp. NPDC004111]|uniref:GntR family transcriptional regulator n=1 Tax=Streptomyces sp. NPDC004111 TaxID=3364690 RepID=UPI0036D0326E